MDEAETGVVAALGDGEIDACLSGLIGIDALLAVSGGVDSMALAGMVAAWAQRHAPETGRTIAVAVVDHGLRDGSADEAAWVSAEVARIGLPCSVLTWNGPKPSAGLQQAARRARYDLLAAHADALGATAIVTAHTLDDQAETLLMRLAAGSGPAGLAGMRSRTTTRGLVHLRPLLGITKERLIATCRTQGWRWVDDPSNLNPTFTRVRWRRLMPLLAREGLSAARLGQFARRMDAAETALQQVADAVRRRIVRQIQTGHSHEIDGALLFDQPMAIVVRVLAALIEEICGQDGAAEHGHGPRLHRIEACAEALVAAARSGSGLRRTLGGAVITLKRDGLLLIGQEAVRRRGCVNPVQTPSLGNRRSEN